MKTTTRWHRSSYQASLMVVPLLLLTELSSSTAVAFVADADGPLRARSLADLADAVQKLPSPMGDTAGSNRTISVPTGCGEWQDGAADDDSRMVKPASSGLSQVLEVIQPDAGQRQVASGDRSEDDGTRTRNHRIDSPVL